MCWCYENSNIYIWQEFGIKVVVIPEYTDILSKIWKKTRKNKML